MRSVEAPKTKHERKKDGKEMSIIPLFPQDPKIVGFDWPHWDGVDQAVHSGLI